MNETIVKDVPEVTVEAALAAVADPRDAGERLRASEKLAALGRLSAGLAHELRNPLNTLNVLVYAMAEQVAAGTGCRAEDLEVLQSEIRRMSLLLDQFLDFARPRPPSFRRQHVHEIVEELLLLVGPEARKHGVDIERRFDRDVPPTWVDGDQLKQAFLNLALNAIQAMPGGGTLTVGVRAAAGGVVVEIGDTGVGIDPAIRERLFEPFFTTRRGGTGLGLAISHRIVDGHSGDLRIDSTPGQGTRVSVWLPR